jgi:NADH-quinone oxidoreductase subunit L
VISELLLQVASGGVVLLGIVVARALWLRPRPAAKFAAASPAYRLLDAGWGFDWLYDRAIVRPFAFFASVNAADALDGIYRGFVRLSEWSASVLRLTQNGRLRWYAAAAGAGTVLAIYLVIYA